MATDQRNRQENLSTLAQARSLAEGLFPHQVEGIAFLLGRRQAILADDMGLGKTRQSIVAALHAAPDGPWLIICPASVKLNWAREIRAVARQASVEVIHAGEPLRAGPGVWTVINYDILVRYVDELCGVDWKAVIFDEAHYLRNRDSIRSRTAGHLLDILGTDSAVYALTGTPLMNRPRDLFPLLRLLKHPLGRSFLSFAKRYCAAYHNGYGWVTDGASNLDELAVQLHGVMLRRTKEQVLNLPPKLRQWLPVEVSVPVGRKQIARVVGILLANRSGQSTAAGQKSNRARLLANLTTARQSLAVAKVSSTLDFVQGAVEQGEKVVVFSCFDKPLRKLAEKFGDRAVVLTGATPSRKRQQLVDRFQHHDDVRVFIANILAGGVGINLTAARQVVFNDLDWVPANHWQAEDRVYRIGQNGTVNITYMTAPDTLDDFVAAALQAKAALIDAVVEGKAVDAATRDVLADLETALGRISPQLADLTSRDLTPEEAARILREAAEAVVADTAYSDRPAKASQTPGLDEAIRLLADVLAGGRVRRWRVQSSSKPGTSYVLECDSSGDVTCTCPGFHYRGQCSHARALKACLVKGQRPPEGYEEYQGD